MPLCGSTPSQPPARASTLAPRCPALQRLALASLRARAEKADRFKPLNVEADQPGPDRPAEPVRRLQRQRRRHQGHDDDPRRPHRGARDARRLPHGGGDRRGPAAGHLPPEARRRRRVRSKARPSGSNTTARPTRSASSPTPRCGACAAPTWPTRSPATSSATTAPPRCSASRAAPRDRRQPGGRVRAVLTPREGTAAAAEAGGARRGRVPRLKLSPALGERE